MFCKKRYVFLSGVNDFSASGGNFKEDPDMIEQSARLNRGATFVCPVSSRSGRPAICTFYDPGGNEYVLFGRGARSYRGVTFEGERGECGIGLDRVRDRHVGTWRCKVLTQRADGKSGSAVETGAFRVTDEDDDDSRDSRDSRDSEEDDELYDVIQSLEEGDDGTIEARIRVAEDEKLIDLFWIVGR